MIGFTRVHADDEGLTSEETLPLCYMYALHTRIAGTAFMAIG